jgi:FkbM family methyltransferase
MRRRGIKHKDIYFVEFGAADGILHSNTFLLEELGARGILVEPCKSFHNSLYTYKRCVHASSGEKVLFEEMTNKQLSKIAGIQKSLVKSHDQAVLDNYEVTTVSLQDLLKQHSAPKLIDYLSVDTEGSELSILKPFDFSEYSFNFISVEHNYRADRKEIHNLLSLQGYKRVHKRLSRCEYWYVRKNHTK